MKSLEQDNKHRGLYVVLIFSGLCAWFLLLFVVLFFAGFKFRGFALSDSVLLALIGGTTASVIGIFLVVVRYLFPKR